MALPSLNLKTSNVIHAVPENGNLIYQYKPFYNLKLKEPDDTGRDISYLTLTAKEAGLNIDNPIEIDIEPSYDQSVNLILNDKENPLKLINSRFYLVDSNTYKIGDRKGNLDTNIYTKDNFKTESNLIKTVQSVVKLDFLGIREGGNFPVGNYNFYFKLADADGNESDFVAESGKVICHIGDINQPKHIRGGQQNENSNKSIRFRLNNLDLAYTYIHVYYTRTTSNNEGEQILVYKIDDKFKINKLNTEITLSGFEPTEQLSIDDINIKYAEFKSAQTLENCQNISFSGNVTNDYELFNTLEKLSLFITPSLTNEQSIGNLNHLHEEDGGSDNSFEYYNVNNIYYRLGYWEDIYRIGIVYILPDYTLSPVFNIRGIEELTPSTHFNLQSINSDLNISEDYIINSTEDGFKKHNSKGVFKITGANNIYGNDIKPIGLKFNFHPQLINGNDYIIGLKDLTKGFFFVRQKRIPTVLAQAIGIGTSKHGGHPVLNVNSTDYISESFLMKGRDNKPSLGSSDVILKHNSDTSKSFVYKNALLCPEADLRSDLYNTYFNSSEYLLMKNKYQPEINSFKESIKGSSHYYLRNPIKSTEVKSFSSSLLLIEPNISLIKNGNNKFSTKAGDKNIAYKFTDVQFGDYSDPSTVISNITSYNLSTTKVRGIFNTFIGTNNNDIESGVYYNIYQKGYDFEKYGNDYFKIRYTDTSPYYAISDRFTYGEIKNNITPAIYRGDCYINTYTRRMHWNFIDPELPTDKNIVDRYTWYKNFRVLNKVTTVAPISDRTAETTPLTYYKLLDTFTFKNFNTKPSLTDIIAGQTQDRDGIIDSEGRNFKKYSEINGIYGAEKISRADLNAVGLGYWVTFKICSNINLAMRDVDFNNPQEEALHGTKRSFYPLQSIEKNIPLPESREINSGISKSTNDRYYFEVPDVPFIKTSFTNRIYYSNPLQESNFVNGNRVFLLKNYQDYTLEYGSLVKLVEWYGKLFAIMEHGILLIPVNERAMMKNESGEDIYINTDNVLPKNPIVISNMYGSTWENSIIKTDKYVYGIDTVGKKIWRTNGKSFEIISDLKLQQFLNENINLKETDKLKLVNQYSIKTHYNAFKSDVLFTFKYKKYKWHLCWNELLEKWITRYSWFPEFSENINNIFYTFANNIEHPDAKNYLYKHGFAGTTELDGNISPAKWYDTQYPFEFEFVVNDVQGVQKIFNNLKIISNKVEPNSFIFEITGDGYDWCDLKQTIIDLNAEDEAVPPEESDSTGFGYPFDYKF